MCISGFASSSHEIMHTTFYLPALSLTEFFCFIFIVAPISSFNPCAFPEELKSKQTTIKSIDAARYQLGCSHPRQRYPPLTLQDPYSLLPVKIQFATSSRWPSFWLSFSECLWLKHSQVWLPCWWSPPAVGQTPTRQIGSTIHVLFSPFFQLWYQICFSCANWFPFLSPFSREPPWFNGTSKVRRACRTFYFLFMYLFLALSDAFTVAHLFTILIHWITCLNKISRSLRPCVVRMLCWFSQLWM